MQYIDGPNFSSTKPNCTSGSTTPQFFKNCSAPGANDGTVITADWLNDVQCNLLKVLEAAGIDPTPCRDEDLKDAISVLIANSLQTIPLSAVTGGTANQNASFDANGNLVPTPFPIIPNPPKYISTGDLKYSYQTADHEDWLLADGSTFSAVDYPVLANLLSGTTLPDLRGLATIGAGNGSAVAGLTNKPLGSTGGAEKHQLTVAEMPRHRHSMTLPYRSVNDRDDDENKNTIISGSTNFNTNFEGGDQPHNNMQPYIALNPFIFAGA